MAKKNKGVNDFQEIKKLIEGSDIVVEKSETSSGVENIADAAVESSRKSAEKADFEEGEAERKFLRPEKAEWSAEMKKLVSQIKKAQKSGEKDEVKKLKHRLRETKEREPDQNIRIKESLDNNLINKNMPKEDITTIKQEQQQVISPEASVPKEAPKAQSRQQEELERTYIPDNRSRFERLKDWAREKVFSFYEKVGTHYLSESPVVNVMATEKGGGILNRIEAAFNDKLMKWHEDKAIGIAQKLDSAKNRFSGFENGRKLLEQSLENYRQGGISSIAAEASARKQMRGLDEKMAAAQADINKYQSKLESRNNKMAGYVNARDRACESLVDRYDEKLRPWEMQVESIRECSENLNVEIERANFKRGQIKEQIDDFSQKFQKFMSRRDLKAALSGLTMQLEDWNKQIDDIARQKSVIDGRISRAEDRANVYRDKKSKIVSYTKGRPIMPETGERIRAEFHGEKEEIKTEGKEGVKVESESEEEGPQEDIAIQDWLKEWNEYLKNKNVPKGDLINESVWQNWIGRTDFPVNFDEFKKSLNQYYGIKALKMPKKNFTDNINDFAEKRRKKEIENKL